jgi:hypothetical protein
MRKNLENGRVTEREKQTECQRDSCRERERQIQRKKGTDTETANDRERYTCMYINIYRQRK